MGECRATSIRCFLSRGVSHKVITAAGIAPDVAQVKPVANFVRGRAAKAIRSCSSTRIAKGCVQDNNPIGVGRPTRELRIAKQAKPKFANPDI
jgi:hypothetical protein